MSDLVTLRADLERHTPAVWHDDHWDFCDPDHPDASCRECEVFWPCDAARALALLDEAEAQVAACVTLFPATVAAGLTDDLLSDLSAAAAAHDDRIRAEERERLRGEIGDIPAYDDNGETRTAYQHEAE